MARESGARMGIVHVVCPAGRHYFRRWALRPHRTNNNEAHAMTQLQQLAVKITKTYGLTPSVHLAVGDVSQEVLNVAETADLLVLGRPHKRRLWDLFKIRTAGQILRASRQPVLMASNPVNGPYTKILVPLDFSASSDAALLAARRLAPDLTLQLSHTLDTLGETVMRETDVPDSVVREIRAREDAGALARMRRRVTRLGLDHRAMHYAVGRGRASKITAQHAQQQQADLIVITRTAHRQLIEILRPKINADLLLSCACDVLVLPRLADAQALSQAKTAQPHKATSRSGSRRMDEQGLTAGTGASRHHPSHFNWLGSP